MKMRPGSQTGFLLCGKEWTDGEALEVRSPWDQGLVGRVTMATRADARQAVNHAVAEPAPHARAAAMETPRDSGRRGRRADRAERTLCAVDCGRGGQAGAAGADRSGSRRADLQDRRGRGRAAGRREHSAGSDRRQRRPLGTGAALSRGAGSGDYSLQFSVEPGGAQGSAGHGRRLPADPEAGAARRRLPRWRWAK